MNGLVQRACSGISHDCQVKTTFVCACVIHPDNVHTRKYSTQRRSLPPETSRCSTRKLRPTRMSSSMNPISRLTSSAEPPQLSVACCPCIPRQARLGPPRYRPARVLLLSHMVTRGTTLPSQSRSFPLRAQRIQNLAYALIQAGIRPGDRVAVLAPNSCVSTPFPKWKNQLTCCPASPMIAGKFPAIT